MLDLFFNTYSEDIVLFSKEVKNCLIYDQILDNAHSNVDLQFSRD